MHFNYTFATSAHHIPFYVPDRRTRAIEQVSFQTFEGHEWGGCSSRSGWQTVPHVRHCHSESTTANGSESYKKIQSRFRDCEGCPCQVSGCSSATVEHFYRLTLHVMQHTVLLLQFCLSVHPSIRCMYCDKTKQHTANILIPHETAITLVFWHQQWLVGNAQFPLKSALKLTPPPSENANCQRLKRAIVTPAIYPRFLNFFTLTSHGSRTVSLR